MDPQTPTGDAAPMNKQETVKDDGRTLIYYTFPPENDMPEDTSENREAAHV
jgi:hypothetical protein